MRPATRAAWARLPGWMALLLMTGVTTFWTFWGTAEMFHEGWWGEWWRPLRYLIPGAVCLLLLLAAERWPRAGGATLAALGGAFAMWWAALRLSRGATLTTLLLDAPVSSAIVILGLLFVWEGARLRRAGSLPPASRGSWLRRHARTLVAVGPPLLVLVAISSARLPVVMTRVAPMVDRPQVIEGVTGQRLEWAPAGPGWGRGGPSAGGCPSWDRLALYGLPPIGFGPKPGREGRHASQEEMRRYGMHRYLSADGARLLDTPQDVWRLPTAAEVVACLSRDGEGVRCTWDGSSRRASFEVEPDKEAPLWDPVRSPIYYWALDEAGQDRAFFVSYNGWIRHQPKSWGNPRHGFRLVRDSGDAGGPG